MLVISDIKVVVLTEDVDFSDHRCRVSKLAVDQDSALSVELPGLAEVIHPVKVLGTGRQRRGDLCQFAFTSI